MIKRYLRIALAVAVLAPALLLSAPNGQTQAEKMARVEATRYPVGWPGSPKEEHLTLQEIMDLYNVPGLSVAVIDGMQVVWAKGYGWADVAAHQPVTPTTLFQAGSISKAVAATAIMTLVQAGQLSLDVNVNDYLKSWKLPDNEFTTTEKVTLRRILSHTAGLTVHGFPGYAVGEPRPTLVQVLNGEPPANTAPVRVDTIPGTIERYAGGGTTLAQLLVTDVTGQSFPEFMREAVLSKIGMTDSSYDQPLPESWAAKTATGYRVDKKMVEGRWHVYPEMAAAGLWTTATDLAKFAIEIMHALRGESKLLTRETAEMMLTPIKEGAGLGFFIDTKTGQFGHNGADEGFQALLVAFPDGRGVAMMMNSDNGTITLGNRFLGAIAAQYGMPIEAPKRTFAGTMVNITLHRGARAAIDEARENLKSKPPFEVKAESLPDYLVWLYDMGHGADALALLDYNQELFPDSDLNYQARGRIHRAMGDNTAALSDARRALELNPKSEWAKRMIEELEGKKK